ncbi:MAG: polysaccharide biosynthesis protein, partial [bacterium]
MKFVRHLLHRSVAMLHDLFMIPIAWVGAYLLRFNLESIPEPFWLSAWQMLLLVIPVQGIVYWQFGLYRGVWRFASMPDLARIAKAVIVGVLVTAVLIYLIWDFKGVPRSVPVLYGILLMSLLSVPRFLYRWIKDQGFQIRSGQRVLIVGAGSAGEMLARDLLRDPEKQYLPVAFADDDTKKQGKEIHGIRVMGGCAEMNDLARKLSIDVVMLAVPSASASQMRDIVAYAEAAGVPFRTVPQLNDLVSGQVNISQIREVQLEDLLGRKPVDLDWASMRDGLAEHVVLVTGAGGSIGSELCRQLANLGAKQLLLVDNSEFNLFSIERELGFQYPAISLVPYL